MRIVLRILIVVLAILSGVALYLGIKLFNQREQLKIRTCTLEQSIVDLSRQIETEVAPDLGTRKLHAFDVDIRDIKQYYAIDRQTGLPKEGTDPKTGKKTFLTDGPGTMKSALKALLAHPDVRSTPCTRGSQRRRSRKPCVPEPPIRL